MIPFNAPPDRPTEIVVDTGADLFGGGRRVEQFPVCDQYTLQGDAFSRAILGGAAARIPDRGRDPEHAGHRRAVPLGEERILGDALSARNKNQGGRNKTQAGRNKIKAGRNDFQIRRNKIQIHKSFVFNWLRGNRPIFCFARRPPRGNERPGSGDTRRYSTDSDFRKDIVLRALHKLGGFDSLRLGPKRMIRRCLAVTCRNRRS